MKLLTNELKQAFPPLYSQDGKGGEAVIVAKFFTPDSNWTWYATEASAMLKDGGQCALKDVKNWNDVEDVFFFGLVDGFEKELGNFSLNELEAATGPLGLHIERDLYFGDKKTLHDVAPEKF